MRSAAACRLTKSSSSSGPTARAKGGARRSTVTRRRMADRRKRRKPPIGGTRDAERHAGGGETERRGVRRPAPQPYEVSCCDRGREIGDKLADSSHPTSLERRRAEAGAEADQAIERPRSIRGRADDEPTAGPRAAARGRLRDGSRRFYRPSTPNAVSASKLSTIWISRPAVLRKLFAQCVRHGVAYRSNCLSRIDDYEPRNTGSYSDPSAGTGPHAGADTLRLRQYVDATAERQTSTEEGTS